MELWLRISLLLSVFGFLKEFRPSEPFIFEFLSGPWRNLTVQEINQSIFPIGTYSYLVFLVIVFLITDFCRYKPLIVLLGICGIVIWSMLLWTTSLFALQIVEVFYGLANACEVAYYTYMYAKVSRDHYQQVTSHARAGTLIGRFLAATISQLVISYGLMDYRDLNYLTLSALSLSTIWGLMLPSVPKSIYFHHQQNDGTIEKTTINEALDLLWQHFITSYSSWHVIKWSIWWALATCGYIQVCVYIQTLWNQMVDEGSHQLYNGGVEAILTLASASSAILAGFIKMNWSLYGEIVLGVCTILSGTALLGSTLSLNIWISYAAYIIFGTLYQFLITVASAEVAKKLMDDSYGLVFGLNTLLALILQSILTVAVVSGQGFVLDPYYQYIVYGALHLILGGFFFFIGIRTLIKWQKTVKITKALEDIS